MRADDARKEAEAREERHIDTIERCRKVHGRRVPPSPARDDRGERMAWRPGE